MEEWRLTVDSVLENEEREWRNTIVHENTDFALEDDDQFAPSHKIPDASSGMIVEKLGV